MVMGNPLIHNRSKSVTIGGLHRGLFSLGLLCIMQSPVSGQTLKVSTEFILFDCTSSPALFEDYKAAFKTPGEVRGVELKVRQAVVQYLRDNVPVQRSIRSVDRVQVGKRVNKTVEIGYQVLSIQILALPASRGIYPMQIQQTCEIRKGPGLGSNTHSQLMQMVPNVMHMRHTRWNNRRATAHTTNEKLILFCLTTLSEQPPIE
jgi:hypothetical protein